MVHLPSKSLLSKSLALKAATVAEKLTNSQLCDCIEVLAGVQLSPQEKRQSKMALVQILLAAAQVGKPHPPVAL